MTYSVSMAAKMLEISCQSLRKWEKQGLIPTPHRRPTGRREYSDADIAAIKQYLNKK